MLRGNYTARIDVKGRLKLPTSFRRLIDEKHGKEFYITSLTGDCVRIYPLPEWESIEQRLSLLPSMDPARRKFLDRTNYYGQQSTMDGQGRVLIHPLLQKKRRSHRRRRCNGVLDVPGSLGTRQIQGPDACGSLHGRRRGSDRKVGNLRTSLFFERCSVIETSN